MPFLFLLSKDNNVYMALHFSEKTEQPIIMYTVKNAIKEWCLFKHSITQLKLWKGWAVVDDRTPQQCQQTTHHTPPHSYTGWWHSFLTAVLGTKLLSGTIIWNKHSMQYTIESLRLRIWFCTLFARYALTYTSNSLTYYTPL